jgi:hypothetical protein
MKPYTVYFSKMSVKTVSPIPGAGYMPKHRISFLEGPFLHDIDQTHLFHVVTAA